MALAVTCRIRQVVLCELHDTLQTVQCGLITQLSNVRLLPHPLPPIASRRSASRCEEDKAGGGKCCPRPAQPQRAVQHTSHHCNRCC
jgi:hypothetical protein